MLRRRKPGVSIKALMIRLLLSICGLFAVLCLMVVFSTQPILLQNAAEYAQLTAQKLKNQLDIVYDQMDVYAMNIETDEHRASPGVALSRGCYICTVPIFTIILFKRTPSRPNPPFLNTANVDFDCHNA